jgi:hypothetical protein
MIQPTVDGTGDKSPVHSPHSDRSDPSDREKYLRNVHERIDSPLSDTSEGKERRKYLQNGQRYLGLG